MQINYCSLCSGYINLQPCKANCEATYTKCMANYQDFEGEWNKFLNTIVQFGKRLENTLNLENTLGSINYKVSDVIMYFQEHQTPIRDRVFEKCSMRKLSKRSTGDEDEDEDSLWTVSKFKETRSRNQELSQIWKTMATEVKKKIKSLKSYWSKLPKGICKKSNPAVRCWNGTHSVGLDKPARPTLNSLVQKNSKIYGSIDTLRKRLQIVNSKLISSYNGNGLEKFDFDPQATEIETAISTEPNDEENPPEEEDDDYEDKRMSENDQQVPEIEDDKLPAAEDTDEEPDENKRRDAVADNVGAGNNLNDVSSNNRESRQIERSQNESLSGIDGSSCLSLSVCALITLIISQLTCRYLFHF